MRDCEFLCIYEKVKSSKMHRMRRILKNLKDTHSRVFVIIFSRRNKFLFKLLFKLFCFSAKLISLPMSKTTSTI